MSLRRLGRAVFEKSADDLWMARVAESNPDGTAAFCRYCARPRESLEAWKTAVHCDTRPREQPCAQRWLDYRGRDKVVPLHDVDVNRVLRTVEDARAAVKGRSVWVPLAIDERLFAPISQGALFALVRHYRDDRRRVGVHVSDKPLWFDTRRGFIAVVGLVEPNPPSAVPRYSPPGWKHFLDEDDKPW